MIEIGIAGAVLLLMAWLFETIESVKRHKSLVDLRFAMIYIVSISLLDIYAYLREDVVFFYSNLLLIILVMFEIFYTVYKMKKK
jgi:lipid-A-disaccharide synthase-like uncharacterized protein